MPRTLSCLALAALVWTTALPTASACISNTMDDPFEHRRRTVFTERDPVMWMTAIAGVSDLLLIGSDVVHLANGWVAPEAQGAVEVVLGLAQLAIGPSLLASGLNQDSCAPEGFSKAIRNTALSGPYALLGSWLLFHGVFTLRRHGNARRAREGPNIRFLPELWDRGAALQFMGRF